MFENWQIKIINPVFKTSRHIFIFRKLLNGDIEFLDGTKIKEGDFNPKPTLELEPEQLQIFADALNEIGYKPQKGFIEGKLVAIEKHLEDMRTLLKLK
jgi:hypothetical protein